MMIYDKKRAVTAMMAKKDPKDGSMSTAPMKPEITKKEDGSLDGRHSAAEDILMAINEKSAQKLMQALANFYDISEMMEDEAEGESEAE